MDDVELAQKAKLGVKDSRLKINEIVFPIISKKTGQFCRHYCQKNWQQTICTLPENPYPTTSNIAPLCEWGNASYAWMLDDLTKPNRLNCYQGKNGASIEVYFKKISNSIPFRERWKDWRFKNRVSAPTCVKNIHKLAPSVFIGLYNQKNTHDISHQLGLAFDFVEEIAHQVLITLTKENKLHLLLPKKEISLTGFGLHRSETSESQEHQGDIPYFDPDMEKTEQAEMIKNAWKKLDCVEQFVLESMLIEGEDAFSVLESLKVMNISIKKNVLPEDTNRQQLFHFKRKSLNKLAVLAKVFQE